MKNIAIVGVTLSGNMGGQAMLLTTLEEMRRRSPGCHFYLLSIYPKADKRINRIADIEIISAPALVLVGFYLPISVVLRPFIRLSFIKRLLSYLSYFEVLQKVDIVIDLSGITFVDGRGIPLLMYNLACFVPAIILDKPVVKLSQAVGPLRKPLNRFAAQWALRRCAMVISRGEQSAQNIANLGLSNTLTLPDVTFALEIPESARQMAREMLFSHGIHSRPLIISPSRVVQKLLSKMGVNFAKEMAVLIEKLMNCGMPIILLPHSLAEGNNKNNDSSLCREILECMPHGHSVKLFDSVYDAKVLRALIGEARFFIGSRFHSAIAALSMGVPLLIIGWSHKYAEMIEAFGLSEWLYDLQSFSAEAMMCHLQRLQEKESEIRQQILLILPIIKRQATINFDIAFQVLNKAEEDA